MAAWPAHAQAPQPAEVGQKLAASRAVHDGIAVEFRAEGTGSTAPALHAGDDVRLRFQISDTAGGTALAGLRPAAWLDVRASTRARPLVPRCRGVGRFAQAAIDLNTYYVLALNEDASISVVDARFGFGGSKLLAMVLLDGPGEDWALTGDQRRLFVSTPDAGHVAVVDTASWKVVARLAAGARPTRVALAPDERHLWVADDGVKDSGVSVFSPGPLTLVDRIRTGRGPHDLAFSDDGALAFVTNRDEGTLSIIDAGALRKVADVPTGSRPVAVAFSSLARLAYVSHEDGAIVAVSGSERRVVAHAMTGPGIRGVRVAPGGRYGFVANPDADRVHVLDVSTNRVIQTSVIRGGPDQITFSATLAYIRRRGDANVLMVPLDQIGGEDAPLPIVDFAGGQHPFGRGSRAARADSIVQVPGAHAVLVANPADRAVYFYKEGMAAPMGHFANYGHEPRSVLVVDRSLRERAGGVYETIARLPHPGVYDVVFFLDAPRVVQCFELVAEAAMGAAAPPRPVVVQALEPRALRPGGSGGPIPVLERDAGRGAISRRWPS